MRGRLNAEHQHCNAWESLRDDARRRQSTDAGHRTVHHDNVRRELCRQFNGRLTITGFSDDVDCWIVFEQASETAPDECMVVHEQDRDASGHREQGSMLLA